MFLALTIPNHSWQSDKTFNQVGICFTIPFHEQNIIYLLIFLLTFELYTFKDFCSMETDSNLFLTNYASFIEKSQTASGGDSDTVITTFYMGTHY